jgi:hypothetical protein
MDVPAPFFWHMRFTAPGRFEFGGMVESTLVQIRTRLSQPNMNLR